MALLLALDQGTTSSRAILFDEDGRVRGVAQREHPQVFPHPGWVEQDPEAVWRTQEQVAAQVLAEAGVRAADVTAAGISNQRETTVVWDRATGAPIHPAIVWQDRRTADLCERLRAEGHEPRVQATTGLLLDPYFSATKVRWILDHVPRARARAEAGELAFGTIDAWLLHRLTDGRVFATDPTNASRTLLYDIRAHAWDPVMLRRFGVPPSMLPEVRPSSGEFGRTRGVPELADGIPIAGIAGDQQAALFGQGCVSPGMSKNTYGTGCFLLLNTGARRVQSRAGLLTTVACGPNGEPAYALEGSVFIAGAAIQWLRDGLGLIANAAESEALACSVDDSGGVVLVPAFVGMGAPHWRADVRGAMFGLTRGTTRAHVVRAALESLAFQSRDLVEAMAKDAGARVKKLRVDGGAVANDFLMQLQADVLGVPVERPAVIETTALGAALLAGLAVGVWRSPRELDAARRIERVFTPERPKVWREREYGRWNAAVARLLG